ncbi:hypothetical protein GOP47_0022249, partial [Adiantum capillus-veneris]
SPPLTHCRSQVPNGGCPFLLLLCPYLVKMVEKSTRISVRYDIGAALRQAGVLKRLRRMPHIFSRMLELPVVADSVVQVQEDPHALYFKVTLPPPLPAPDCIRAQIIHIVPGVTQVSVAGAQLGTAHLEELDVPLWRCRLPPCSIPEASTAACNGDGLLVLTVPKSDPAPSLLPWHSWQQVRNNQWARASPTGVKVR